MSTHHHLMTRVNRVFVDFENVSEIDGEVVGRASVFLTVFCGAQQTKLDIEVVKAILSNPNQPKVVSVAKARKNALDFVLATELGRAIQTNPASRFHIISKDTGYDALIEQLRGEKIWVHRHDNFEALRDSGRDKASGASGTSGLPENSLTAAVEILSKCARNRPAKRKTLAKFFRSSIGLDLTKQEAQDLINQLCSSGRISIGNDNKLTYEDLSR